MLFRGSLIFYRRDRKECTEIAEIKYYFEFLLGLRLLIKPRFVAFIDIAILRPNRPGQAVGPADLNMPGYC